MKDKLFIVGDVHGEWHMLKQLLKYWDDQEETLVFLGDLLDRGPDSKKCLLHAQELVLSGKAIYLSGNHEDIFLQWLDEPEAKMDWYTRSGGVETVESLLYPGVFDELTPIEVASEVKSRYAELIQFIKDLPVYYETDHSILVHAGVDLTLPDWRDTSRHDFIWIREEFHRLNNDTGKLIFFGHTPVQSLHNRLFDTQIWFDRNKVGIDGGAVYHGSLHGVVVSKEGILEDHEIIHPKHQWGSNIRIWEKESEKDKE